MVEFTKITQVSEIFRLKFPGEGNRGIMFIVRRRRNGAALEFLRYLRGVVTCVCHSHGTTNAILIPRIKQVSRPSQVARLSSQCVADNAIEKGIFLFQSAFHIVEIHMSQVSVYESTK